MILDIIVIVVLLLMILYGYKKGFVKIIAKLVSVIIAFILAYLLASTVGTRISNTSIGMDISSKITENIASGIESQNGSWLVTLIKDKLELVDEQQIVQKITDYIYTGMGFVIIFIVARIVLYIAQKIIEKVFELPILKTFNKLGGVMAAVVLYVIEISIILAVIKSLSAVTFMTSVVSVIENSIIVRILYNYNVFTTLILSKIF